MNILRSFVVIAVSVFAAMLMITLIEGLGHIAFPLHMTPEQSAGVPLDLPFQFLVPILFAHFIGTWSGARLAGRMAPSRAGVHALIVGLLMLAATIANLIQIHHPLWFGVLDLLLVLFAILMSTLQVARFAMQTNASLDPRTMAAEMHEQIKQGVLDADSPSDNSEGKTGS
jgi:hypothetical protein